MRGHLSRARDCGTKAFAELNAIANHASELAAGGSNSKRRLGGLSHVDIVLRAEDLASADGEHGISDPFLQIARATRSLGATFSGALAVARDLGAAALDAHAASKRTAESRKAAARRSRMNALRAVQSVRRKVVYQSEHVMDNPNPRWRSIHVPASRFCGCDGDAQVRALAESTCTVSLA